MTKRTPTRRIRTRKRRGLGGNVAGLGATIAAAAWQQLKNFKNKGGNNKKIERFHVPMKFPNSFTTTKTKTEEKPDISHVTSDGTRSVKFTVVLKKKVPKHDKGQWNYSQTHQVVQTAVAGRQSVQDLFSMGNIDQFTASTGSTYSVFQNHTAIQQLNPYLSTTGSVFLPPTATPLTDRFLVKNYTMKTTFASFGDVDQTGWIYYLTPRVHVTSTPLTAWQNSALQMGAGKAAYVQPAAGTIVGGTAGPTRPEYPYETPLRNSSFSSQWKILKCVKIQLAGGSHQIVNATFKVNKIWKQDQVSTNLIEGSRYMPGLTIFVMPVWLGEVVMDTTTMGAPIPTYSTTRVGVITVNEYTCSSVHGNAGRLSGAFDAINIPGAAAVTNQQQILEDTGAVDAVTLNI